MTPHGVYSLHGNWNLLTVTLHPAPAEEVRADWADRHPDECTAVVEFVSDRDMPATIYGPLRSSAAVRDYTVFRPVSE